MAVAVKKTIDGIPDFLIRDQYPARNEASIAAFIAEIGARKAKESGIIETIDPEILAAVRRGEISKSVLTDPVSRVYFLSLYAKQHAGQQRAADAAKQKEETKMSKVEVITVKQVAEDMSKGRKDRVKKSFIRNTLDKAGFPKRSGRRVFMADDLPKVRELILKALNGGSVAPAKAEKAPKATKVAKDKAPAKEKGKKEAAAKARVADPEKQKAILAKVDKQTEEARKNTKTAKAAAKKTKE